jgi:hypothetical protein
MKSFFSLECLINAFVIFSIEALTRHEAPCHLRVYHVEELLMTGKILFRAWVINFPFEGFLTFSSDSVREGFFHISDFNCQLSCCKQKLFLSVSNAGCAQKKRFINSYFVIFVMSPPAAGAPSKFCLAFENFSLLLFLLLL